MTHIKDLKIGVRVREFRNAWGWTLPELSTRSGISKGLLSKIENDPTSNVTIGTLIALANAFETEVHELLTIQH